MPGHIVIPSRNNGAIALSYPPRVRVRAGVKLSATFFHNESSITIGGGGYESAIVPGIFVSLYTYTHKLHEMRRTLTVAHISSIK